MDVVLLILALLCVVVGLLGCIVPVLPGPPVSYVGLLLLHFSRYGDFGVKFLIVWAVITVAVTVTDYVLPPLIVRKTGGSRAATRGSLVGLIAGFFIFPPWGIILFPFLGALVGELLHDRTQVGRAFGVAAGSFAAFILGTGVKLIASGMMLYYVVKGAVS